MICTTTVILAVTLALANGEARKQQEEGIKCQTAAEKINCRCIEWMEKYFTRDSVWFIAAWNISTGDGSSNKIRIIKTLLESRNQFFRITIDCESSYREGFFITWNARNGSSRYQWWRRLKGEGTKLQVNDILSEMIVTSKAAVCFDEKNEVQSEIVSAGPGEALKLTTAQTTAYGKDYVEVWLMNQRWYSDRFLLGLDPQNLNPRDIQIFEDLAPDVSLISTKCLESIISKTVEDYFYLIYCFMIALLLTTIAWIYNYFVERNYLDVI